MAVNIGPRIGIDGEKEYRKSINDIIQQQKTLKSEMSAVSSSWDKNTSAMKRKAVALIIVKAGHKNASHTLPSKMKLLRKE